MTASHPSIILASASPRRREILSSLRIPFEVQPSGADEDSLPMEDHLEFVRAAALLKLESILSSSDRPGAFVLAADTIVCAGSQRLGKPADEADALRMLELLVGRVHLVRTAIALGRVGEGALDCRIVETRVSFGPASRDQLTRYVAGGESLDKAGGYGVQGLASGFVNRIEGSYSNVVGLPAAEVVALLLDHHALKQWP